MGCLASALISIPGTGVLLGLLGYMAERTHMLACFSPKMKDLRVFTVVRDPCGSELPSASYVHDSGAAGGALQLGVRAD